MNYDALQAWPNASPRVEWESIPTGPGVAFLDLRIANDAREEVYRLPDGFSPGSTSVTAPNLPIHTPLTADLSYVRVNVTTLSGGATTVGAGRGFDLQFPLACRPPPPAPPVIVLQPVSQVLQTGDTARLSVAAIGASLSYQWKKDGVAIPLATKSEFNVASMQLAEAGSYTVEVTNEGGRVTSEPAVLRLLPTFKFREEPRIQQRKPRSWCAASVQVWPALA